MKKIKEYRLDEIARIDISGVDKKIKEGEHPVNLCNFTDVYNNWAVTNRMHNYFMKATANDSEICRFALKKGMVAITKDSETRDDIGMSTYIADDLDETILGYHTALIIPDEKKVDGSYLNGYLNSDRARTYFSNQASGSGQRYTLTVDGIGSVKILLPELKEQKKIGGLLSAIDRKIELNMEINDNLQHQLADIYDYWFVQFNFPNKMNNPYQHNNGEMKYNNNLNCKIPVDWIDVSLADLSIISTDGVNPGKLTDTIMEHYSIPAFDSNHFPSFEPASTIESNKYVVYKDSILVSKLNPQFRRLWNPLCISNNSICSTEFIVYRPIDIKLRSFLYCVLNSNPFFSHMVQNAISSTGSRKRIQPEVSSSYRFAISKDKTIIEQFCRIINPILEQQNTLYKETHQLTKTRDWLLPMFMNGQATIVD